jgi:hypothetical protein
MRVRLHVPRAYLLAVAVAAAPACNVLSGADDLDIAGDGAGGDDESWGDGTTAQTSSGAGDATGGGPAEPPAGEIWWDAPGVTLTQIALYQGVKRPLMEGGLPASSTVPVVGGREGLLRAWVATDGYDGEPVIARLFLNGSEAPIDQTVVIDPSPSDAKLGSTVNFDLSAADLPVGFTFRLELRRRSATALPDNPRARYPATGFADAGAKSAGHTLRIKLVPVVYGADGSNRMPDVSSSQVEAYRQLFYSMYPAADVEITVRDAVPWGSTVSPDGTGWGDLLGYVGEVRAGDGAPNDQYYYGLFSPASSVSQFCGGGCVAGLANIAGATDSYLRAAIGLGFGDSIATETAVHEIGHAHGRYHAPCGGAQGVDPGFPHGGAQLGAWGYDVLTHALKAPTSHTDVMGYCFPIWVSDYTFEALFDRSKALSGASVEIPGALEDRVYDRARIDGDGALHWLAPIRLAMPPLSEALDVTVQTDAGVAVVDGHFHPYDHLPGGLLIWPQAGGPTRSLSVHVNGRAATLSAE